MLQTFSNLVNIQFHLFYSIHTRTNNFHIGFQKWNVTEHSLFSFTILHVLFQSIVVSADLGTRSITKYSLTPTQLFNHVLSKVRTQLAFTWHSVLNHYTTSRSFLDMFSDSILDLLKGLFCLFIWIASPYTPFNSQTPYFEKTRIVILRINKQIWRFTFHIINKLHTRI